MLISLNQAISKVIEKTYDVGVAPVVETYQDIYSEAWNAPTSGSRRQSMPNEKPALPLRPIGRTPPPAVSPRVGSPAQGRSTPPSLLPREASALGQKMHLPNPTETLLADEKELSVPVNSPRRPSAPVTTQDSQRRSSQSSQATGSSKRPFFNRLLLAGEVVLTSVEASVHDILNTSTAAASSAAG